MWEQGLEAIKANSAILFFRNHTASHVTMTHLLHICCHVMMPPQMEGGYLADFLEKVLLHVVRVGHKAKKLMCVFHRLFLKIIGVHKIWGSLPVTQYTRP